MLSAFGEVFRVDRLGVICVESDREARADRKDSRAVYAKIDERTGFLHGEARVARTGVQTYSDGDRSWGEYRDAAEVFEADSLDSYQGSVWTSGHPAEFVTADNVKALQIGHSGSTTRRDETGAASWVVVPFTVTDPDVIASAKRGDVQISVGYWQRPVLEAGTHDGEAYAVRQTAIRVNHIAALKVGDAARAGPEAAIPAFDSKTPVAMAAAQDDQTMSKAPKADPAEIKAPEAPAPAAATPEANAGTPTADAAHLAAVARLDVLAAENESLRARLDARDKADADRALAELVTDAKALAPSLDCAGKTDTQIRAAIVAEIQPELAAKVADASAETVRAYFDAVIDLKAQADKRAQDSSGIADLRKVTGSGAAPDATLLRLRANIAAAL